MIRLVGSAALALGSAPAAPPQPPPRPPVPLEFQLQWTAPSECPQAETIRRRVAAFGSGSTRGEGRAVFSGEVRREADGYSLILASQYAGHQHERRLSARRCDELGESTALVITVALDHGLRLAMESTPAKLGGLVAERTSGETTPAVTVPAPAVTVPAPAVTVPAPAVTMPAPAVTMPAPGGPTAVRPSASAITHKAAPTPREATRSPAVTTPLPPGPTASAPPGAKDPLQPGNEPTAPSPPFQANHRVRPWARLAGFGEIGTLGVVSGGVQGAIAASWPRWRGELLGRYEAPRRRTLTDGRGARLQAGIVGLRGCFVPQTGRLKWPLCADFEGGTVRVDRIGLDFSGPLHTPWVAAGGSAALRREFGVVALWVGLEATARLVGSQFAIDGRVVFDQFPVSFRWLLGVEFDLRPRPADPTDGPTTSHR